MARRLLFLGFFLPPSRASGVYRTRALANRFAAEGWDVTALAAPVRFLRDTVGSVDDSLLDTLDPRVEVLRPTLDTYAWEKDLRAFGWLRRTRPRLSRRRYEWLTNLGFPEHYASWGRACVRAGVRLHRRRPFDAVLATGNPYAAFAAAWGLRRLRGLPYAVDFRDSWTLDQFGDAPRYAAGHPAVRWERRIMGAAAAAVFVNEPTRRWYADRYPGAADRTLVVPNGWDPDLLDLTAVDDLPAPADRPLRLGFLGTVTDRMPLAALAAAFRLARRSPALAGATLDLYGHLGFQQTGQSALREPLGLPAHADTSADGAVRYRGPVAKTAVAGVYAASDVLVFLAGGSRYVTSGKVFEYMAAARPIVSVHAPGIAAEDVLAGYPLWFRADSLAPEALAAAMAAAADAARAAGPGPRAAAREWAARYERDRLLTPLVDRLAGIADTARAGAR